MDSAIYEDRFTFIGSDGRVFQENQSSYVDGETPIRMKAVTPWIQVGGIQGFQRVYKMTMLGEFITPHCLKVKIGYNYNEAFIHEADIDAGALLDSNKYGEGSPYGSGDAVYGGEYPLYQFEIKNKRQKCQAIRYSIEDIQSDELGEGYSLSNMNLTIGVKSTVTTVDEDRSFKSE